MTNEEAIKVLTEQLSYSDDVIPTRLKEAYEVAINSICTISQNAKEKEKIFADFNDSLQGVNSEYGLSYYLYSNIYNIGRELADKEYQQGRADAIDEYKERLLEICDCGIEQADCTGGNCYKCMDNQVDYSSIVDLANELKEKNMAECKIVLPMTEEWKRNMKIAYNKALDDFYKALEKNQQENWTDNLEYGITFADVEKVINQLKL